MDICGKSSMRDGLLEILPSATEEIFTGRKHTVLNETSPSPGITGKQTFLL
jgi:hypothetical protein